jgi:sirohydrochlorin ferrochelatase
MTYRIDEQSGNIDVRVEKTGADDAEFLAALARCRDGRCECPTDAYDKLEDVRIERDVRGISVHLEAKPGQSISQEAVATCLDYTLRGKK